jgi:hypothetical protein
MIIFIFVMGFLIGVLVMAFFKGAAMQENSTQLILQEQLIESMADDWIKVYADPSQFQFIHAIASSWVGEKGKLNKTVPGSGFRVQS